MKRYLNRQEKNELTTLLNMQVFLEKQVALYKSINRPTKWLSSARSFLNKVIMERLAELDVLERRKAMEDFGKLMLVLRTKKEVIDEIKALKEADMTVPLLNDDFLLLCSYALGNCEKCSTPDYVDCKLRAIFIEYDIEPISEGGCQYCK